MSQIQHYNLSMHVIHSLNVSNVEVMLRRPWRDNPVFREKGSTQSIDNDAPFRPLFYEKSHVIMFCGAIKGGGGLADLKISKAALLSFNHHNLCEYTE